MVERGPEKAGVGGSIPSLGTFPSIIWQAKKAGIKGHFPECALFCADFYVHGSLMDLFIPQ